MKNRNNGSRIFLTELMFSILFFIIVVAVCIQCFAKGYILGKSSDVKTHAINVATNAAEEFIASDDNESFTLYYDKQWKESEDLKGDSEYVVTGMSTEDGNMVLMNITVSEVDSENTIYSLEIDKALPYLED